MASQEQISHLHQQLGSALRGTPPWHLTTRLQALIADAPVLYVEGGAGPSGQWVAVFTEGRVVYADLERHEAGRHQSTVRAQAFSRRLLSAVSIESDDTNNDELWEYPDGSDWPVGSIATLTYSNGVQVEVKRPTNFGRAPSAEDRHQDFVRLILADLGG